MNETKYQWVRNLTYSSTSVKKEDVEKYLHLISKESLKDVEDIIPICLEKYNRLPIVPTKETGGIAFHIQIPEDVKPYVMLRVLPKKTKRVLIQSQKYMDGYKSSSNTVMKYEKYIESPEDIKNILSYCQQLNERY